MRPFDVSTWIGSAVLVAVLAVSVNGQPPSDQRPTAAPVFQTEVVVTAERGEDEPHRLSVPTVVLARPAIESTPGVTLAEALETLPGFHMLFSSGSGFRPTTITRGFFGGGEAEYVKLLVDGVPLSDPESGLADWRLVPVLAIERVEAVRGPASAAYGDASLGGVVQVFTRQPLGRVGRASIDAGSFGHRFVSGEYHQPAGRVGVDVLASYAASDGFRQRSGLTESLVAVSLRGAHGPRQWHVRGAFDRVDREEPGALTRAQLSDRRDQSDPLFRSDADSQRKRRIDARYARTGGRVAFNVIGHATTRSGDRVRTLLLAPGLADRAHRDIRTDSAGGALETAIETMFGPVSGDLRSGIETSGARVETAYRAVSMTDEIGRELSRFDGRRAQFAAYVAQSANVLQRLRIDAGLRWDRIRDSQASDRVSHTAWSPKAGATLLFGESGRQTAAFVHASQAFKAATLDQLFDPRPFPDFRGGTFVISNPALRPQRAKTIEGGVRQMGSAYRWELVFYRMRVTDEIDFDPATFSYANIGRSTHEGAEIDATWRAGAIATSGISYAWTRVLPETGAPRVQLKNIPRHLIRPHLTLTLPRGVLVYARYIRTAGAFADDANAIALGDRSTVDMRVAKKFAKATVRLDLINLNGDRYEEVGYVLPDFRGGVVPYFYPAPGFAARAGVELSF